MLVEGDTSARELVVRDGGFALVPQPERLARCVIGNAEGRAEIGPIVRDSTRSRVSLGYGLHSVTALVEIGDEDPKRLTLEPMRG